MNRAPKQNRNNDLISENLVLFIHNYQTVSRETGPQTNSCQPVLETEIAARVVFILPLRKICQKTHTIFPKGNFLRMDTVTVSSFKL